MNAEQVAQAQQRAGEAQALAADALKRLAEAQPKAAATETWRETLRKYAGRAVVAIAASLGLAGLVAVLGAGILYVQFQFAQIPAWQALAVIEDGELIVFGAAALVLFVILGAAAVAMVYLLDKRGAVSRRTVVGLVGIIALEMGWALIATEEVSGAQKVLLGGLLGVAWGLGSVLIPLAWPQPPAENNDHPPAASRDQPSAVDEDLSTWERVKRDLQGGARTLVVLLVAGELVILVLVFLMDWVMGLQFLVAFLIGLALLRVAWLTGDDFLPYAMAVLVSVPVFGALAIAIRTAADPVAQPAAVVRKDDDIGVCGLYVAETEDRIYLARTDLNDSNPRPDSGRIFWVARKNVVGVSIGDRQDLHEAVTVAPRLRAEVLADRLAAAPEPAATEDYTLTTTTDESGKVEKKVEVVKGKRPQTPATGGSSEEEAKPVTASTPCTEIEARK